MIQETNSGKNLTADIIARLSDAISDSEMELESSACAQKRKIAEVIMSDQNENENENEIEIDNAQKKSGIKANEKQKQK